MNGYLFHSRAIGAIAAASRAVNARMEGEGQPPAPSGDPAGQPGGSGQPPAQPGPAAQPAAGSGDPGAEDWKARAREWEKRAKENKAAADRLAELEKANMSELEKAQAEAKENGRLAAEAKSRGDRLTVAIAKGLPLDLAERLVGSTIEELEADADKLLGLIPANQSNGRPPTPDLRQGQRGGQAPLSGDAWLRGLAATKRGR